MAAYFNPRYFSASYFAAAHYFDSIYFNDVYFVAIHLVNVSDIGSGFETPTTAASFTAVDSGIGVDAVAAGRPYIIQVQGLQLPQVQLINRIGSLLLGLQPLPGRGMQYARELATNGDTWEINGFIDRVTLEQLFAIPHHGTVWVTSITYGRFHATIEVEAAWVADDAPQLES
ncbi:MAG: hypothetical protein WB643_03395 [Candidatus Bathyarchaeia archaeon]